MSCILERGGAGCKMFVKLKILQRRKTLSLGVIHFYRQKHSVPNDGGKHSSNKCYVTNTFPSCCRRADSSDTVVKYRPLFLNKKPKITDIQRPERTFEASSTFLQVVMPQHLPLTLIVLTLFSREFSICATSRSQFLLLLLLFLYNSCYKRDWHTLKMFLKAMVPR